jgi:hypothetical protein
MKRRKKVKEWAGLRRPPSVQGKKVSSRSQRVEEERGPQKGLAGKPCEAGTLHRIIALGIFPPLRSQSRSLCRPISLWSCASFTLIVREKGRRWASKHLPAHPSSPAGPTFFTTLPSDFSTFGLLGCLPQPTRSDCRFPSRYITSLERRRRRPADSR